MIKLKYFIFDVGGVILSSKSSLLDNFLDLAEQIKLPKHKAIDSFNKYKEELTVGALSIKDFLQLLLKKTTINLTVEELSDRWSKTFEIKEQDLNQEIFAHIKHLRKSYKTCLFSNCIDTLSDNKKINKWVRSHFDYVFNSYNIGFKKPDIKAFHYILNKLQALPQECVFIDDEKENILVAKKLGFKPIKYEDKNRKFFSDLEKNGIKI